jgi:plasmid stability protein
MSLAFALKRNQNGNMSRISIRNLPPEIRNVLQQRAAISGLTLEQYVSQIITESANTLTWEEVFEQTADLRKTSLPNDFVLAAIGDARDHRDCD